METKTLAKKDTVKLKSRLPRSRAVPVISNKNKDKDQPVKAKTVRRQWQSAVEDTTTSFFNDVDHVPFVRASDLQFERLKEGLAADGTAESLLSMALDFRQGLDQFDPEEVQYREEQAIFWLTKAAEKGSKEALKKLEEVKDAVPEVQQFLALSDKERLGRRIGNRVFQVMEANQVIPRGLCHLAQLQQASQTGHFWPNFRDKDKTCRKLWLTKNECLEAGLEFVQGTVPGLDRKLFQLEHTADVTWIIYKSNEMWRTTMSCAWVQVTLAILVYHLITAMNFLHLLLTYYYQPLMRMLLLVLTMNNLKSRVLIKNRMSKWKRIFQSCLQPHEAEAVDQAILENRGKQDTGQLLMTSIVISVVGCDVILVPIVIMASSIHVKSLIPVTSVALMAHKFVEMPQQVQLEGVERLWPLILALPLLTLSTGLAQALKTTWQVVMIQLLLASDPSYQLLLTQIGLGLSLALWIWTRPKAWPLFLGSIIVFIIMGIPYLLHHDQQPAAPPVPWSEFRQVCSVESSPDLQLACSSLVGLDLEVSGRVTSIALLPPATQTWPLFNRALRPFDKFQALKSDDESYNGSNNHVGCHLTVDIDWPGLFLRRQGNDQVQIVTQSDQWPWCQAVASGDKIRVMGSLKSFSPTTIDIDAKDLTKL